MTSLFPGQSEASQGKPVLIVGAGPTGMTAAMELIRFGVPVRLIDRYTTPPDTSRALAVQSRTLEMMQQRGLAAEMVHLGNKGLFATLYADGHTLGRVEMQSIESRFNYILLVAQSETERLLREHLQRSGLQVERQTELIAFSQGEGSGPGVQATLRKADGTLEEAEGSFLIDAEGAHSIVRHTMDLAFAGNSLPNSYALADLHVDGDLEENQLSIFLSDSGLLAAFPMGNHRFRIIATEKNEVDRQAPDPDLAYMQGMWSAGSHIAVRFYDMVWSSRFRINSRALKQLRHGNVFFGGDSAHIHSPAGGQGMNTGIQDMMNLGWKLALVYHGHVSPDLLDTYGEERLPIIQELLATTERATDLFNSDKPFIHNLVRHALPLALSFQGVRQKGARMISELGGDYRSSSLSKNLDGTGQLRPGDRFPDVPIDDSGRLRSLDLLNPSAFTILKFGSGPFPDLRPPLESTGLWDRKDVPHPHVEIRKVLSEATIAVVRPDGYLLCSGTATSVSEQVEQWFTKWGQKVRNAERAGAQKIPSETD